MCNPKKVKIEGKGLQEGTAEFPSMFIINIQDCGTGGSWKLSCEGPGFIGSRKNLTRNFFLKIIKSQYILETKLTNTFTIFFVEINIHPQGFLDKTWNNFFSKFFAL